MPTPNKLPKFEDWKAPWEAEGESFDPEKGKKFLYGLLSDKERLQATNATLIGERDTARQERDTYKAKVDEVTRKDETEIDRLKRERDEAIEAAKKAPVESPEMLRLQVALEKGLTGNRYKRLVGATREELEADADELLAEFGGSGESAGDGDGDGDGGGVRGKPAKLTNPGDPKPDESSPLDVDKALDLIPRPGGF